MKRRKSILIAGALILVLMLVFGWMLNNSDKKNDVTEETLQSSGRVAAAENEQEQKTNSEEKGSAASKKDSKSKKKQKSGEKDKAEKEKKEREKDKDKKTCRITIHDGASAADTKYVVNGLHVYDPTTVDKEDFVSGDEVPVGTNICVFAYNLASPVRLTIVHNGEVIAERTYSVMRQFVDDHKVEFFKFKLEGDLVVTTEALPKDAASGSTMHINNEALGSVLVGKEDVHDGDVLRNGTYNVTLSRADRDVRAALTVGGETVGTAELTDESPSAVFRRVSFDDEDIYVEFTVLNAHEETPAPPAKSRVRIENGRLGTVYRGSTELTDGASIIHGYHDLRVQSFNRDIEITLKVNGTVVGTAKLKGGMKEHRFSDVHVTGDVSIAFRDITPTPAEESFLITLEDKVKNKDVSMDVGYIDTSSGTPEPVQIVSGKKYSQGLMVGARVLNGTDRELKLTAYGADGTVLDSVTVEPKKGKIEGANGFYLILNQATRFVVDYAGSVEPPQPPAPKKYTVTVEDQIQDPKVTRTVGWIDTSSTPPKNVDIVSGNAYPEGLAIGTRVVNDGDRAVVMTVYEGGKQTAQKTVAPGAADGYYIESLSADSRIVFEPGQEEPKLCRITVDNGASSADIPNQVVNGLHVYDPTSSDKEDFESGAKVPKDTSICVFAYNLASPIRMTIVHNGVTIAERTYSAVQQFVDDYKVEKFRFKLEGDLVVTTEALPQDTELGRSEVSINGAELGTVSDGRNPIQHGDKLRNGTYNLILSRKDQDVDARLTVGGREIGTVELTAEQPSFTFKRVTFSDERIQIDFISKKPAPQDQFTVTVEDRINNPQVITTVGWIDFSGEKPEPVLIISGNQYPKGLKIGGRAINDSDRDVVLTVYEGGQEVYRTTIKPRGAGGYYIEELSADSSFIFEYAEKPAAAPSGESIVPPEETSGAGLPAIGEASEEPVVVPSAAVPAAEGQDHSAAPQYGAEEPQPDNAEAAIEAAPGGNLPDERGDGEDRL